MTFATLCRFIGPALLTLVLTNPGRSQEAIQFAEEFRPGHAYKVDVQVKLSGRITLPAQEKGKPPQVVPQTGTSKVVYDERILAPDDPDTMKAVRAYREVDFRRVTGTLTQDAGIRPSVRRMVVIKNGPRKAPFSPDGPLTWGEIDVVRTDVFSPVAVAGILPRGPVRPKDSWRATPAAVAELTDMEKVDEGDLTVEFLGVTAVDGKRLAKLRLSGTVRGVNEDGPNRQKLEGTAYFDLAANVLTYLSVRGSHELLDGATGRTFGVIEGQFTMTRTPVPLPADLSDASLRGLDLKPGAENTLLLHDNPDLGVRFLYPRSWRVDAVQGRQVTLVRGQTGAGMLITVEPASRMPTADDYLKEIGQFLQKEKAQVTGTERPTRLRGEPVRLDTFTVDAAFGPEKVRLEYAVLRQTDGGVTVAARLPAPIAAQLRPEVDRIVRSLAVTRKIEEK
jgi:hypothetical protein